MDGYWIGSDTGINRVIVQPAPQTEEHEQTDELDRLDALAVLLAATDSLLHSCDTEDTLSVSRRLHAYGGLTPRSVGNLQRIIEPYR